MLEMSRTLAFERFSLLSLFYFILFYFITTPVAHGSSQARGQMGAAAEGLSGATARETLDLSHICDLRHSLQHCQILNPLSKARD